MDRDTITLWTPTQTGRSLSGKEEFMTKPPDREKMRLGQANASFHRALRQFPGEETFKALHFFWNEVFAGQPQSPAEQMDVRKALATKLDKMADSYIVDLTPVDALGRFDELTYGDIRKIRAALRQPDASAGEPEKLWTLDEIERERKIALIVDPEAFEATTKGPEAAVARRHAAHMKARAVLAALPPSNPPGSEPGRSLDEIQQIRNVTDALILAAMDVLHHDRNEGSDVDKYERQQLRAKFSRILLAANPPGGVREKVIDPYTVEKCARASETYPNTIDTKAELLRANARGFANRIAERIRALASHKDAEEQKP